MPKKDSRSLVLNALSNYGGLSVSILIGLILTPFIIKHLGKEGYGIWTLIWSVIGYYGLMELGIKSAVTRYVARYAGQKNYESMNQIINTAMTMYIFIGVTVAVISLGLASPLSRFLNISQNFLSNFKPIIVLLGITTGIGFPANVLKSVIVAHERFVVHNIIGIIIAMIRSGLTVWVLIIGYGLLGLSYVYLLIMIIDLFCNLFYIKILIPSVHISFKKTKFETVKLLFNYGYATFIITVSDHLRFNLDSIVIGKMISISQITVYRIAALIVQYFTYLVTSAMGVLTPRFSSIDGRGEVIKLKSLFLQGLLVSALLSFGLGMLGIIFGGKFIDIWVGKDFEETVPVLWILVSAFIFELCQSPSIGLMYATGKHKYYALMNVIEGIVNLLLSILLAPKFGIVGVALGTAIPMLIIKTIVQPIYVSKIINISPKRYYLHLLFPFIISSLVIYSAYIVRIITDWRIFQFRSLLLTGSCFVIFYIFSEFILLKYLGKPLLGLHTWRL